MIKKTKIILLLLMISLSSYSQSKYGSDSVLCVTNLSLFREYYKQKNYEEAVGPWRWTFKNCPEASGNIYKNGAIIFKQLIKDNPAKKKEFIDTLMLIYDQRIRFFGNQGYVLGRKGADLLRYDKSQFLAANEILSKSINIQKNNSEAGALLAYFNSVDALYKNKFINIDSLLSTYEYLNSIIEFNINKSNNKSNYYKKTSELIEKKIVNYINCDKIEDIFFEKFNSNQNDSDLIKRIYRILSKQNCEQSNFYFLVANKFYEFSPSSSLASKLAKMHTKKNQRDQAILFFDFAIDNEEIEINKARYLLEKADALRIFGDFNNAVLTAKKSNEFNPNSGEFYMTLGNIYIAGATNCGNEFEQSTVYWIAVDQFTKALVYESTLDQARKSINTYSKYFPTKEECFFNGGLENGEIYTVQCWINKQTKVRTSD